MPAGTGRLDTTPSHGIGGEAARDPGAIAEPHGTAACRAHAGLDPIPGSARDVAPPGSGAGEFVAFRGRLVGTGRQHLDRHGQDTPSDDHHAEY